MINQVTRINQKLLLILIFIWVGLGLSVGWLFRPGLPPEQYPEVQIISDTDFESFQALTDFFANIANEKGAVYAFQVLKVADLPPNTDVHLLGHTVGDILYQQEGKEGIKHCTPDFRNACSHTVVIGLFLDYGEDAIPIISDACHQAPGGKGAYTMCFHGLGHGVLAYTGYELEKAATLCDKMGTEQYGFREASECLGGATMEMASGVHDPDLWQIQLENYLRDDDPLYPCTAEFISDRDRHMCITYWTPRLFELAGANLQKPEPEFFAEAFTFCQNLGNEKDKNTCYASFGKEFIVLARDREVRSFGTMTEQEMRTATAWCELASESDGVEACIVSAVNSLYWGGENPPEVAVNFCKVQENAQYKKSCYQSLMHAVDYYITDPSYRQLFCGQVEEGHQQQCQEILLSNERFSAGQNLTL